MIDSVLELNEICVTDIKMFNYIGGILNDQSKDSVMIPEIDLKDLCTYSQITSSIIKPALDSNKKEFNINGYLDAYFFKNLNNPLSGMNIGKSGYARAFDQRENQFQIGLVQTKINYRNKNTEALIDLTFGPHSDLGNYGNVIGSLGKGNSSSSLAIKQAYFTYNCNSKIGITVGQFGTHIGYEVIDAPVNFNYSLSNLFNNGPFYHIGIKGTYKLNSNFSLMAGIVNNWDNLYDNNKFKTAIFQLSFVPNQKLAVYLNYIGGDEETSDSFNSIDSSGSFKQLADGVINYHITSKLYIGFNGVVGSLSKKNAGDRYWGGAALYCNYLFGKRLAMGLRGDFFDNNQGVMYIGETDVRSVTLTCNISIKDNIFFKPEIRLDNYKQSRYDGPEDLNIQQFEDSKGHYVKSSQITVGACFIYSF